MKTKIKTFIFLLIGISSLLLFNSQKPEISREILWTTAWSPNGKFIAVGGNQGDLKLFDGKTFQLIKTFPVKDVIMSRLKWHPTRNLLAVVTQDRDVIARILNVDSDTWIDLQGLESSSRGVDWNRTGELLAVSEFEGEVSVFTPQGKRISRFMADPMSVTDLDWHPNKDVMVTVGSQIGIYRALGDTINNFKSRNKKVLLLCVEWHPSGDFFVSGDYGDFDSREVENVLLQFWNPDGIKIFEITSGEKEYRNIRWNPIGTKLASASEALRIWSAEGSLDAESQASDDLLWGVDWSPDGKFIVTSSRKGHIVLWDNKARKMRELEY